MWVPVQPYLAAHKFSESGPGVTLGVSELPPTHTPCLVTTPPHSQSLQFQPGQQTDLSLPLSTLTLVFEVGVPAWSPKKPPRNEFPRPAGGDGRVLGMLLVAMG